MARGIAPAMSYTTVDRILEAARKKGGPKKAPLQKLRARRAAVGRIKRKKKGFHGSGRH